MVDNVQTLKAAVANASAALSAKWDELDNICPSQREVALTEYRQRLEQAEAALDAVEAEVAGASWQPVGGVLDMMLIRIARQNGYEHLLPARLQLH